MSEFRYVGPGCPTSDGQTQSTVHAALPRRESRVATCSSPSSVTRDTGWCAPRIGVGRKGDHAREWPAHLIEHPLLQIVSITFHHWAFCTWRSLEASFPSGSSEVFVWTSVLGVVHQGWGASLASCHVTCCSWVIIITSTSNIRSVGSLAPFGRLHPRAISELIPWWFILCWYNSTLCWSLWPKCAWKH